MNFAFVLVLKLEDQFFQKYHLKIIKGISEKESGHQRELLKLVIDKNLSEEEEGRLFEVCIEIWKDIHKKPGTRSYAFKFIHQVVLKYPEIKNELVGLFESEYLENMNHNYPLAYLKRQNVLHNFGS